MTVLSAKPVLIPAPERGEDVQVRVSAPATGDDVPVIVFSHGFGCSMSDYDPLVDYWTALGFAVLQPTHLDSLTLGIAPEDPRTPEIWRFRIDDLKRVIDNLDVLQAAVPGLAGPTGPQQHCRRGPLVGRHDRQCSPRCPRRRLRWQAGRGHVRPRVKAGVLLALAGHGEEDLTPFAAEHFPFMSPDFARMTPPALPGRRRSGPVAAVDPRPRLVDRRATSRARGPRAC